MTTTAAYADAAALAGTDLGWSDWLEVTQDRIDTFADATDDHQWIHVDPERAAAGPFGAPIAHGYLTLSLTVKFWTELFDLEGVSTKVNYGLDKVRFPAPVPVNSKLRAERTLLEADLKAPNTIQLKQQITIEIEGSGKPACVAEFLTRLIYS